MSLRASWLSALLLTMAIVPVALGFVPEADRVTKAVAKVNKVSGRSQALRLDLDMRIDGGDVVAIGELVTHPTGLARLELRGSGGLIERHVLQGSQQQASRNGERLTEYRSFLPPLFLLQADSKVTLDAALADFGVRPDVIALAPCGESNCYVLGDPRRVVSDSPRVGADEAVQLAYATIWVDIESFDVMRIESSQGVQTTLGPVITSDGVRSPSWIRIEEAGQSVVRFDVTKVTLVNAPAVAFSEAWLLAPLEPARPVAPPAEMPPSSLAPPVDPQRS